MEEDVEELEEVDDDEDVERDEEHEFEDKIEGVTFSDEDFWSVDFSLIKVCPVGLSFVFIDSFLVIEQFPFSIK